VLDTDRIHNNSGTGANVFLSATRATQENHSLSRA